jgi:pilus assembly protein Flp/PilA
MSRGTRPSRLPLDGGPWDGKEVSQQMPLVAALIHLIRREDEGQGLAEYALILSLIAIVAIVALIFLGGQVSEILSDVGNSV